MSILILTEAARDKVAELILKRGDDVGLRIKVIGGGCSGLRYQLSFEAAVDELDMEEDHNDGVRTVVDPKSAPFLVGTTIDFVDDLNQSGFVLNNPNATNSCGCGDSFSA